MRDLKWCIGGGSTGQEYKVGQDSLCGLEVHRDTGIIINVDISFAMGAWKKYSGV